MSLTAVFLSGLTMNKYFHRNYLFISGVAGGIIIALNMSGIYLAAAAITGTLIYLIQQRKFREILLFVISLLLGSSAGLYAQKNQAQTDDQYFEDLPLKIIDSNAFGNAWNPEDKLPKTITAQSLDKDFPHKIQLYFPQDLTNPGLQEGNIIRASGNFYALKLPPTFLVAGQNGNWRNVSDKFRRSSYQTYLQRRNIAGTMVLEKLHIADEHSGVMAQWRKTIAQKLDKNLNDQQHRAIFGAVTLGLRSRLSNSVKHDFANLGIAHLFSVSGLHVGVLALLLLLATRPLPLAWHWLLLMLLVCYVNLTGGNAPAIRAFCMVLAVEFFRSQMLRVRPLELLSAIAAVLLLINPFYITDAGFQYSFVATAILITAVQPAREISRAFSGEALLIGEMPYWKKFLLKWRGNIAGSVFYALIVSLSSLAMTLFFQNIFFAGSMLVNLLILPTLLPLFVLAVCKCLWVQAADFWNIFIDILLDYLEKVVELSGKFADAHNIMRPHYLAVLLFVILLFITLQFIRSRKALLIICILFVLGGTAKLNSSLQPEKVAIVIAGGRLTEPLAAIILPQAHTAYLLNIGYDAVEPFADIAVHYGITQIDRLDFSRPVTACSSGVPALSKLMPIRRMRKPSTIIRSQKFLENTGNCRLYPGAETNKIKLTDSTVELEISQEKSGTWLLKTGKRTFMIPRTAAVRTYIVEL